MSMISGTTILSSNWLLVSFRDLHYWPLVNTSRDGVLLCLHHCTAWTVLQSSIAGCSVSSNPMHTDALFCHVCLFVFRPSYVTTNYYSSTFLFESAWSWLMQETSIQPINRHRSSAISMLVHCYPHYFLHPAYFPPHISLAAVALNGSCGSLKAVKRLRMGAENLYLRKTSQRAHR